MRPLLPVALLLLASVCQAQSLSPEQESLRIFLDQTINSAESFDDRFHAEVWLVDMSARLRRYMPERKQRLHLLEAVHRHASRSQLPPELVLAVIEVESHFDNYAISRSGAQGLMQVMPFWRNEIGRTGDNLTDITTNLSYGCRILQFYLQQENGRLAPALARYNGSAGSSVYSDKVEAAWRHHWKTESLNWHSQ